MAKAISSATDFLAALSCEPEAYETNGVTVELRSLTFTEVQKIATQHRDDSNEMAFQAMRLGLVAPKLDDGQFEQVRSGKAGPLMNIAKRVMQISGMMEDSGPLAGGGSSASK
jgi:hypothetical protein